MDASLISSPSPRKRARGLAGVGAGPEREERELDVEGREDRERDGDWDVLVLVLPNCRGSMDDLRRGRFSGWSNMLLSVMLSIMSCNSPNVGVGCEAHSPPRA
jgi:hypothetical protein